MNLTTQRKVPSHATLILLVLILGFLTYSFVFGSTFKTLDDYGMIVENPNVTDLSNIKNIFTSSYFGSGAYYRPMLVLSFMFNYQLFGLEPVSFYITNLLIHLSVVFFVFLLVKEFFDEPYIPFFTSLLFAVHPIHWIIVSTITGRSSSLLAIFFISSIYFFILFSKKGKGRAIYAISLICFILALLTRETAVIIPLILIGFLLYSSKGSFKEVLRRCVFTLPYFLLIAAYMFLRHLLGIVKIFNERTFIEISLGFLTFLRALITHLRLFILPVDLHFDRTRVLFQDFHDYQLYLTLGFFGLLVAAFSYFRGGINRRALFFIAWFIIILFPVSQIPAATLIQPGVITAGEHHLYLPSIGIFTLVVNYFFWVYKKNVVSQSIFKFAVFSLMIILITITINQIVFTRNEINLHKQTLAYEPHNIRIRNSYVSALIRAGLFEELEHQYREILEMEPGLISARIGIGKALIDQGRVQEGVNEYEKIDDAGPYESLLKENLRLAYQILKKQGDQLNHE